MSVGKCPNCGGEVKNGKCLYCDTVVNSFAANNEKILEIVKEVRMAEAKAKNKKYTVQLIVTVTIIVMMVIVIGISLFINFSRITRSVSKLMGNSSEKTISHQAVIPTVTSVIPEITDITKIKTQKIDKSKLNSDKGRWSSGIYEIGKDIPEGTYLVVTDGQASEMFPMSLHTTSDGRDDDNFIGETWAGFSRYITLTKPGFVEVSWANIYDIEENDVENNPFERPGMFLVGRDVEPGTYELEPDTKHYDFLEDNPYAATYTIYSDVDAVTPVVKSYGSYTENVFVTLKEGEFIKLEKCVLKE